MPSLGADMEAGTLVDWKKSVGQHVQRGDIIADVETEKGIIEVEVFMTGVVERLLVEPGTKVPVGTPLATIREDGEPVAPRGEVAAPRIEPAAARGEPPAPRVEVPATPAGRTKISPAARRRARELSVDLSTVTATGPDGAVTLQDIERRAAQSSSEPRGDLPTVPPPAHERIEPRPSAALSQEAKVRMRQAIASSMARSKREIPHYYVSHTVDVSPMLAWLEAFNARAPIADRLIAAVPFLKAVALSLRDFPAFNGFWMDGRAVSSSSIHVGAAIALRGGGLVAPALRDTDKMSLPELMKAFRDVVARARAGTLRSSEMSDPTITVTSLGDRGTEAVTGVIYPPQLAIIGFGRIVERPWVVNGAVVPRSVVHISLAADHRATDGHEGALFLAAIADKLMEPEKL